MASKRFVTVALTALLLVECPGPGSSPRAQTPASGCLRDGWLNPDVLLCDDFENPDILPVWDIGSNGASWPNADFVVCGDGLGYGDRCAAWSNRLIFDTFWGFWGYDAWRSFTPQNEFYVRWYQYISDPYTWGTLEDKSVMLHNPPDASITAYVATNRNEWPAVPDSGPGMPFVANYQDLDWPETGGQYTKVNRFQNQGNDITLQPGRWYLFEWYVKLNTPGASDGVTRLWVDDASAPVSTQTLRLEYDDMRWRRSGDADKQFGFLRLTVYHQRCDSDPNSCPPNGPAILDQWQRWDHVVVSRRPVGPLPLAPVCSAAYPILRPAWPPNHKFVVVTIGGVTDPRQQPLTITIASVTRDEPADERRARHHAHHDDDSDPEPVIRGDTVFVPVEHKGNHGGPEYRVDFTAHNTDGLECTGSVRIPTIFRTPHPHK